MSNGPSLHVWVWIAWGAGWAVVLAAILVVLFGLFLLLGAVAEWVLDRHQDKHHARLAAQRTRAGRNVVT